MSFSPVTSAFAYESYVVGSSRWLLKRRWAPLQEIPEHWGWHTVAWCGAWRDQWFRGNAWTYPLIPSGAVKQSSDSDAFEEAFAKSRR